MRTVITITVLSVLMLSGCLDNGLDKYNAIDRILSEVKTEYAPDKRVAVFEIKATLDGNNVLLAGNTDQKTALSELKKRLQQEELTTKDEVNLLPDADLKGETFGVINNSVANIRSLPKHSAELATQAILGTRIRVLKKEGEWYLVQTPDKYISWIDHGGFVSMNENSFDVWDLSEKVIFLATTGSVYQYPEISAAIVGDIVMGCMLKLSEDVGDFYEVQYPDGRLGFIEKSKSEKYTDWLVNLERRAALIRSNALSMKGLPYLWGGTSSKAVDCSGFTKTVYFMNGLIIPRDASQQVNEGLVVDAQLKFEGLEVGDLLFFGRPATDSTKQRTTHVAIWMGDGEFIHASKNVRISSVNPNSPLYDSMNVNRYLGSKRYFNNLTKGIVDLKEKVVL